MSLQVLREHYDFEKYVGVGRWNSYYCQLKSIYDLKPERILEIGAGRNIIKNLIGKEYHYISTDIDPELSPDVVGNILNLPFRKNYFDTVLCFQVLEHFPYDKFEFLLGALSEISSKYVLLGLPYANHEFSLKIKTPFSGERKIRTLIPKFYQKHQFDGQHYWEIGKKGFPMKRIIGDISKIFYIEKYFVPFEFNYHAFFILKKR